jgi:ABC-type sugar transport system substrate-binding protein
MVAAGCGSNETGGTKAPAAKTIKIGLAMPQIDEITQNLYGSYEAYAETLQGVEIILTDAEGSAEQQSKDIESLISQNCDVIIIRAVDGDSITAACDAAANANIPLVIDGTPVATSNYAAFVSENQSTHGRLHGEYLQGLLDKGDIKDVRIGYIAGDSNADMLKRMTGISDTCPSATFTAEIEKGYALAENWSAEEARGIVESWISSGLINDMNVIACMDAALANAVVAALGDDYSDMIVLGAGADNPLIWQNIEDGKIKATTRQDNTVLVKKVMDTCVDLAGGVEITFDEPASRIVDPQNITLMTAETISDE